MDVLPAGHLIGTYKIVGVAGRGAVGVVYEAEHTFTGRKVAIKTLNRTFAGEPEFRARFDREARGAASVDHPNITAVFDSGEDNGVPYLVMTYVDGPDLERILEQHGGPLDAELAVRVCAAVGQALDAAAATGLAHRDVKPANILLASYDAADSPTLPQVYLTDFGLTKHNAAATVTRTGQFVGTLLYMSPEQIEGKAVAASDQYSLACVLYECLAGVPPFLPAGASNLSLLTAHLSDPIPSLSERSNGRFSPRLDRAFQRALAKQADQRYPSCTEFMNDVAELLSIKLAPTTGSPGAPAAAAAPPSQSAGRPDGPGAWGSAPTPAPTPTPAPSPAPAPAASAPAQPWAQAPATAGPGGVPPGAPVPGGGTVPQTRPPGLPAGLPLDALAHQQRGGGRRTLVIALVLLAVAVAVGIVVILAAGNG